MSGIRPKNGQQNGQGRQSMKQTKSHDQKEYFEKSAEYMRFRSCQEDESQSCRYTTVGHRWSNILQSRLNSLIS